MDIPKHIKEHIDKGVITDRALIQLLVDLGQAHLFNDWDVPGINDAAKQSFLSQIRKIDACYPGGLITYQKNAKRLLSDSQKGVNTFDGWVPHVPSGIQIDNLEEKATFENIGMAHIDQLAIVMVAGGLGERLGYEGIKIEIPLSLVGDFSYLEWYIENIRALERKSPTQTKVPFVIMTSNDTHDRTHALLSKIGYELSIVDEAKDIFRYKDSVKNEIVILRQSEVPALVNTNADFSVDPANKYRLQVKPHGHGDVHMLLFHSGLVKEWGDQGKRYTAFIQDTNGQVFNALVPTLGVSIQDDIDFNFVTVPREAGEATGSITKLVHKDGRSQVANVEYNQLDPLLRETVCAEGDIPDNVTGKSPYPANLNVFIIENNKYLTLLTKTDGIIAEFINPKYADETKTVFKSPARLETMMQDLAPEMTDGNIQFTNFPKRDVFSPVKNNMEDAKEKLKKGNYPDAMMTGEADFYKYFRALLSKAGVKINVEGHAATVLDVTFQTGAKVLLYPSFISTIAELEKIDGGEISDRSVVVINGKNVQLKNIKIDGAFIVNVVDGAFLRVENINVVNEGWEFVPLTSEEMEDKQVNDFLKIRGYRLIKKDQLRIDISEPGEYFLTEDNKVNKVTKRG